MRYLSEVVHFLKIGIWGVRLTNLPAVQAFAIRCLRVVMLAIQGFIRHDCSKNATVLTYYSLLNIVPLIAVMFAIAKGFGLKKIVEGQVLKMAGEANLQPEVTNQILGFSNTLLTQAKGGLIAGVGVVLLLWTLISILGKIEDTFNTVWEVKKSRTLVRKFTDYIAIMVLCPILFAISSSATVLIASQVKVIIERIALLGPLSSVILFLMNLLPYFTMWVLMMALYIVMPNTRVPVRSGILAGIAAGTVYQVVQWVYIKFQIGVAHYGAIYGSFAALPLFLGWLQMSWMILLFGSEIAYANEHSETFGFHPDYDRINHAAKKLLFLRVFRLLVGKFHRGERPFSVHQIAYELEIPVRLSRQILSDLIRVGLAAEVVEGAQREPVFQPARSIEEITIKHVLDEYEQPGGDAFPASQSQEADTMAQYLKDISNAVEASSGNAKLKDI
jgi:membrane protein